MSEHDATDSPQSYEAASARLEEIIARLDSGEAELRETLALCTEAKDLIRFCKGELDEVSGELQELELDQLVAELEDGPGGSGSAPASA
jgi:exodeoxyribonuclease VII small subunit